MKLNENLFNLGLDAHIKAAEIADNDPVGGYEGKIWQNIYRTKFAELIVRVCINEIKGLKNTTADDMISKGYGCWDSYSGAIDDSTGRLEEHFGVKQ